MKAECMFDEGLRGISSRFRGYRRNCWRYQNDFQNVSGMIKTFQGAFGSFRGFWRVSREFKEGFKMFQQILGGWKWYPELSGASKKP